MYRAYMCIKMGNVCKCMKNECVCEENVINILELSKWTAKLNPFPVINSEKF